MFSFFFSFNYETDHKTPGDSVFLPVVSLFPLRDLNYYMTVFAVCLFVFLNVHLLTLSLQLRGHFVEV